MPGESLVYYAFESQPGNSPLPRADLYRRLTRNIQREIIEAAFPLTCEVLGEAGMEELVGCFLQEGGPDTLQYPSVPDDLVRWAERTGHRYADLLDFERTSVRAGRHPADIDSLRKPDLDDYLDLNPTLTVSSYMRPVHEITAENSNPRRGSSPLVYLAWRCPQTDVVELHRVGIALGRCLGWIGSERLTRKEWLEGAIAREPGLEPVAFRRALSETCDDLIARWGICAAPERNDFP